MGTTMSRLDTDYSLRYTLKGHTRAINALRFSPDGKLLASAASDSELRIWSTYSGECLQVISNAVNGPVTDVIWVINKASNELGLMFACADGTVHTYVRSANETDFQSVVVTCAHASAVESITFDPTNTRVATAGAGEVKLWVMNSDWTLDHHASVPPAEGATTRTVHFSKNGQTLIATYLETSKVVAWNVNPWNQLWSVPSLSRIGHAALSPDGCSMLVHNFNNGADSYTVPNMRRQNKFHAPVATKKPKQVAFDAAGTSVIQGSDKGLVYISDFENSTPLQTLVHSSVRDALVPTVTVRNFQCDEPQMSQTAVTKGHSYGDEHWIASGCASKVPIIKIWKRKHMVLREAAKIFSVVILFGIFFYLATNLGLWTHSAYAFREIIRLFWILWARGLSFVDNYRDL